MLRNRLRHEGWAINVKSTWRIYRQEGLAVRRFKKLPMLERQPLVRSGLSLVMVAMSAVHAASAYPAGLLSDRPLFGRQAQRTLLASGLLVLIIADLVLANSTHWSALLVGVLQFSCELCASQTSTDSPMR